MPSHFLKAFSQELLGLILGLNKKFSELKFLGLIIFGHFFKHNSPKIGKLVWL